MSKIHYFQRYSTKENVITNNTLHLLKRIYLESPKIFENVIQDICGEKSEEFLDIGPLFDQQTGGAGSIPDGKIRQNEFNILVETKRGDDFDIDQLKQHMDGFKNSKNNILIGVCRADLMSKPNKEDLNMIAIEKNCRFEISTFSKIILICRTHIPEFRLDLVEMIDDFEDFCSSEEILEPKEDVLLAFPCSDSYEQNIKYSLYFCHKTKVPKRKFQLVGFYSKKSIRGFGTVRITDSLGDSEIIAELYYDNPKLNLITGDNQILDPDEQNRIIDFMHTSFIEWGWLICNDHSFFFLSDVTVSDFKKITPYPLQHYRFFNLTNFIEGWTKLMSNNDLASSLKNISWS